MWLIFISFSLSLSLFSHCHHHITLILFLTTHSWLDLLIKRSTLIEPNFTFFGFKDLSYYLLRLECLFLAPRLWFSLSSNTRLKQINKSRKPECSCSFYPSPLGSFRILFNLCNLMCQPILLWPRIVITFNISLYESISLYIHLEID